MTLSTPPRSSPADAQAASVETTRLLARLWQPRRLGRSLAYEALTIPLGIAWGTLFLSLVAVSAVSTVVVVVAVPMLLFTVALADTAARSERSRAGTLLGLEVPIPHRRAPEGARRWTRVRARLTRRSSWKAVLYFALVLPVLGVGATLVLALWSGALALVALPAYVSWLPGGSADFGFMRVGSGWASASAGLVGLVVLALVAPGATLGQAALEGRAVRWFLGRRKSDELVERLGVVEASREAAIGSAENERRRIERDLHDGVQQRLVALAMDLGRARERLESDPAGAGELLIGAHEDAKMALAELRDLTRGIYPAILTDRGLDAALSAVVARCPLPVALSVEIGPRPPAVIESAAYFVVSEALTNVVKHARASRARVGIARSEGQLVVAVDDDGAGGAQLGDTGGLAGLAERVTALGGWIRVISPPGGPTSLMVELPCAS